MHLGIKKSLQISGPQGVNDGPTRARITLDDGTRIIVRVIYAASPSPSFFIEKLEPKGASAEAFSAFLADKKTHAGFNRMWELYQQFLAESEGRDKPIPAWLGHHIQAAIASGTLVLRLEGRKHALINRDEPVSTHLVFYSIEHATLGTVRDIEVL